MRFIKPILFAVIALVLFIYTYLCVDVHHNFIINAGWNTNMIDAKLLFYLMASLGFCLAIFYGIFSSVLFWQRLITIHLILYSLLVLVILLWDNNSFSLQSIVDSKGYNSIGEVRSEYKNVLDKDHLYRVLFWILLSTQTIGLFNLILGFFKSSKD